MNAKVYLVRCRQEDRAGAHLQPGCEPRSWIETHIVATVSEDVARQDVRAKVRRQGYYITGDVTVLELVAPAPAPAGGRPMKPTVWDRIADWVFDDRHGWRPFIIILTLVAIWALILESAVGLDVLRHLLGWNLY